ncbi:tRNA/rRNA methyltransferase [Bacteroidia bacterium]|nr:tRNA/rRNA methyltransferase [Bacteroidia bacterium]
MKKKATSDLNRLSVEQFAVTEKLPVAVVLDNIRSGHNTGSFFRTCDSFAVRRLVLCGITATPPDREIHKTALGAELTVAWSHCPSTVEALEELRGEGYLIVAVEQVEGAVMLGRMEWERGRRYALVFGNEVSGVGQQAIDLCDLALEIPQAGTKHSLNVAVAGGAVLWDIFSAMTL